MNKYLYLKKYKTRREQCNDFKREGSKLYSTIIILFLKKSLIY